MWLLPLRLCFTHYGFAKSMFLQLPKHDGCLSASNKLSYRLPERFQESLGEKIGEKVNPSVEQRFRQNDRQLNTVALMHIE